MVDLVVSETYVDVAAVLPLHSDGDFEGYLGLAVDGEYDVVDGACLVGDGLAVFGYSGQDYGLVVVHPEVDGFVVCVGAAAEVHLAVGALGGEDAARLDVEDEVLAVGQHGGEEQLAAEELGLVVSDPV